MQFSLDDIFNMEEDDMFSIEVPTISEIVNEKLRKPDEIIHGAPNFRYREFVRSDTATRLGIDNTPNESQWQCIEKVASNIMQPVREHFGRMKITSGFRSVDLCLAIGSKSTSNHTKGQAVDFEPFGNIKLFDILEWICYNLEYRELIGEFLPGGWIHVAYREGANTKTLKLKDNNHHYKHVDLEYIRGIYG